MKSIDDDAARKAPREYFEPDNWPYGPALPGTPVAAVHAAELAVALHEWAVRNSDSLTHGLERFATASQLPPGTLRHMAKGDRWPGLDSVARVEWALGYSASNMERVCARLVREGELSRYALPPAVDPAPLAQRRTQRDRAERR